MSLLPEKTMQGWILILTVLVALLPTRAGAAEDVSLTQDRIIAVVNQQDVPYAEVLEGFRAHMSRREPQPVIEIVHLSRDAGQQADAIAELRAHRPRLILALGSIALQAVSREIYDIPILFGLVLQDPHQPVPGNSTGVFLDFPLEIQFTWLRRILPEARNIGVIYNPLQNQETIIAAERTAQRLGLRLESHDITSPRELPAALEALANSADVFWGIGDQLVVTPQTARSLLLFSFRNRIPFIGLSDAWVKAGALYALDRDYPDIGRQCAVLAEKILQGAQVENLPPESPQRVTYILNRHTAEQMKLELPVKLLRGAAKVY
jgi:putative tryptophan/tyrosine transport system substrate-binding protein